MDRSERAAVVAGLLAEAYPEAECELVYGSPWQLLVATVLSAQCTDQRVNQVTPGLFARWGDPAALAEASRDELEAVIRPTGFFRQKAASLQAIAGALVDRHGGEVPRDHAALVDLPGIGRKTANVVLGEAYGIPSGIAVDTHVKRVSFRLGLTDEKDPERIADELESLLPQPGWIAFSMRTILHGRRVCVARTPRCGECTLEGVCLKRGV